MPLLVRGGPLIQINSLTSEEQTVPEMPLMRCHEVYL